MSDRYYVRIDRDDGSRTYKGAWSRAHCEREAAAWRESFPTYGVELVLVRDALADVRRWARVTRPAVDAPRYYPDGWPRVIDGATVWACCVSSIGPACNHRRAS